MRVRYTNRWDFVPALALAYAAKKQGEIAPGVGVETDLFLVTRHGWQPILPTLKDALVELYAEYEKKRELLAQEHLAKLGEVAKKMGEQMRADQSANTESADHAKTTKGDEKPEQELPD